MDKRRFFRLGTVGFFTAAMACIFFNKVSHAGHAYHALILSRCAIVLSVLAVVFLFMANSVKEEGEMKNHGLWMALCCLLPLLLIFAAPVIGLNGNNSIFFFIVMMFACHFMMMGGGHRHDDTEGKEKKGGSHGCH